MRQVIVTGVARADLTVVDELAGLGVATVHEAIGRTGYLGPGLRNYRWKLLNQIRNVKAMSYAVTMGVVAPNFPRKITKHSRRLYTSVCLPGNSRPPIIAC